MLSDARGIERGAALECDLCIIGAGAAGVAVATALAERGLKIIVLEAGGRKQEADSQDFYRGESANPAHPDPGMYRQRRLGGSTTIWGGRCVPFDPIDFEKRDYVPLSGWPFARTVLEPYYRLAQSFLDAGEFDYSARSALAHGALIEGLDDPHLSTDSIERYSLPTNVWKKFGQRLGQSPSVQIICNAACIGLETNEGGKEVLSARCADPEGRRFSVRARDYVVASGGLETYRLLAVSGPGAGLVDGGATGRGLGNQGDMLGRTYMCHVEFDAGQLELSPAGRNVSWGFEQTRDGVYARRRFTILPQRQQSLQILNGMVRLHHANVVDPAHGDPILSTMFMAKRFIIPEFRRKLSMVEHAAAGALPQDRRFWLQHAGNALRGTPALFAFLGDWTVRRWLRSRKLPYVALPNANGIYALDTNLEQSPDRDSRVLLSGDKDRFGIPRLRIDWRIGELEMNSVLTTLRELKRAVESSGVGAISYDEERISDAVRRSVPVGGHHIGTARMSADPRLGVTDPDCKVHDVANLHLAGAAVFPTSGHANPTLTLVALAMRLADRLAARQGVAAR